MDISPQITAAHAKILTKGPPNIIKPPSTTKLNPDQLDISFALAFIQAIVYLLILALRPSNNLKVSLGTFEPFSIFSFKNELRVAGWTPTALL